MNLAGALGYHEQARLLIINADDFGLCHTTNRSIRSLFEGDLISSATIMTPSAWAREAALWSARHPKWDVGIHWTTTSEWDTYKWGPIYRGGSTASLVNTEGHFHRDSKSFERSADPIELRMELAAQIETALRMGMRPTHADNHMGSLYGLETGRDFLDVVFEVCAEYGLPFRLPRYLIMEDGELAPSELAEQASRHAEQADRMGVIVLDYLFGLRFRLGAGENYDSVKQQFIAIIQRLRPGVSELLLHPSEVTSELQAFHREPIKRGYELQLLQDPDIPRILKEENVKRIGWRELQKLQRHPRYRRNN